MPDSAPTESSRPTPSHPARSARWGPWRAQPRPAQPGRRLKLLLLHGFAGTPAEMRPLGGAMLRRGFSVQAPLLPGHGENWHAMTEVRLQDWIEAVRLTYLSMRNDERPVAIIGFCLGGALALRLAGELYPRAICTLATPVRPLPEATFPLSGGICSVEKNINDSSSVEVRRWRQRGCHPVVPEPFFAQYQQLLEELLLALPSVKSPLLVAQSRNDAITTPEDAERIVACVQSERRKLVWSRRAGHALPIDTGRRALFSEIVSFLENEEQAILSSY